MPPDLFTLTIIDDIHYDGSFILCNILSFLVRITYLELFLVLQYYTTVVIQLIALAQLILLFHYFVLNNFPPVFRLDRQILLGTITLIFLSPVVLH